MKHVLGEKQICTVAFFLMHSRKKPVVDCSLSEMIKDHKAVKAA